MFSCNLTLISREYKYFGKESLVDDTSWYRINTPSVIFETMENEVIIINLDVGYYYSLHGLGADIWNLIHHQVSVEKIISRIAAHFQQPIESVKTCIQPFLDKLLDDQLIAFHDQPEAIPATYEFSVKSIYDTPKLHKYEDMKNLLFLDPIHEVDEQGWPSQHVFERNT